MITDASEPAGASPDGLPGYAGQDIEGFTVFMVHAVAARLGVLPKNGPSYREDEMRENIMQACPDAPALIDEIMAAYRNWSQAKAAGASDSVLNPLSQRTQELRTKLADLVSKQC